MSGISTLRKPVVVAALLLVLLYGAMRFTHAASIDDFAREYAQGDAVAQGAIADEYLNRFPASVLLDSIEAENATKLCHVQAHPMGRAVYRHTGNFSESIRQCGNACTYGCFHGAMMEMFSTESDTLGGALDEESPEDIAAHVKRIAPDLCDRPEVVSAVPYRFCTHGVGHMFAFIAHNDLDAAIADCGVMKDRSSVYSCVTGVFMEHMFDPQYSADTETKTEAPCDRFPSYAEPCLRYKAYGWIRVWGGVEPALAACDMMGKDSLICIRTVGEATSSAYLRSTKEGFSAMCGSLEGEKFKACVVGALLKIVDVNDGDSAQRCDEIAPEYRDACVRVTAAYLGIPETDAAEQNQN